MCLLSAYLSITPPSLHHPEALRASTSPTCYQCISVPLAHPSIPPSLHPSILSSLTLQLAPYKAALHHVEQHGDHDVQQLALLRDVTRQLLVAEELHADVHDAVGHGVRLLALHQRLHDEGVVLHERLRERDLG